MKTLNYAIKADSKKRRSFVVPLFTAGYGERACRACYNDREWKFPVQADEA